MCIYLYMYIYICICICIYMYACRVVVYTYGVATISRLLKNTGRFRNRALQKRRIFCERDLYL